MKKAERKRVFVMDRLGSKENGRDERRKKRVTVSIWCSATRKPVVHHFGGASGWALLAVTSNA